MHSSQEYHQGIWNFQSASIKTVEARFRIAWTTANNRSIRSRTTRINDVADLPCNLRLTLPSSLPSRLNLHHLSLISSLVTQPLLLYCNQNAMAIMSLLRPRPCTSHLTRACRRHLSLDSRFMLNRLSAVHRSSPCHSQGNSSLWSSAQAQSLEQRPWFRYAFFTPISVTSKSDVVIRRPRQWLIVSFPKGVPFSTSMQCRDGKRYGSHSPELLKLDRFYPSYSSSLDT